MRNGAAARVLLALALATGCGSTVQARPAASGGGLELGAAQPSGQSPTAGARAGGIGTISGPSSMTGRTDTSLRGPHVSDSIMTAPGLPSQPVPSSGPATYPPGVTAKTIAVGVMYETGGDAAAAAAGVEITYGDQKKIWTAVIDDINARGGILGRRLVPVFYAYDVARNQTYAQIEQEACTHWTEDNKVFAVASLLSDTGRQCLYNHGVKVILDEDINNNSADTYKRFPTYLDLGSLDLDRLARAEVASLARQAYFSSTAVVGVMTYDYPTYKTAVNRSLLSALRGIGHPSKVTGFVHSGDSPGDLAQTSQDVQNVVLKMRSEGVTHVLIIDGGGSLTRLFINGAQAQGWTPRYGFNSMNATQLEIAAGTVDPSQLKGALGMGYWPVLDLRAADNPADGRFSGPGRRQCEALMRKNGITADGNALAVALTICDAGNFLDAAMTAGGPAIGGQEFLVGAYRASTSFSDGLTLALRLDDAHHDGVAQAVDWVFDDACSCMQYRGRPYAVP